MSKQKLFLLAQSILCVLLVLLLAAAVIGLYREGVSLQAEDPLLLLSLALTVIGLALGIRDEKAEKAVGIKPEGRREEKKPFSHTRLLQGVVLALALTLIAAGVCNGSAGDVFGKAVKICTECVGLG